MAPANYVKTDAGRDEIKTRAHKLAGSLRSLLLVVDGQRNEEQLKQVVVGLHAPPDALQQLESMGLITRLDSAATTAVAAPAAATPLSDTAHRYGVLYALMSDAVGEHLGLRGYFMQLKIERCTDADDLLALLQDLRAALAKAKGEAFAEEWAQRLQTLASL